MQFKKYFFALKGFPVYFIPIFRDRKCYGFIMRGSIEKFTPRFCTTFLNPGCERIIDGCTVFMAEGIKDVGPLLSLGLISVPMLTAVPNLLLLKWFKHKHCRVIIVPDCDEHTRGHIKQIAKRFKEAGFDGHNIDYHISLIAAPSGYKKSDLGDWYDVNPIVHEQAKHNLRQVVQEARGLKWI